MLCTVWCVCGPINCVVDYTLHLPMANFHSSSLVVYQVVNIKTNLILHTSLVIHILWMANEFPWPGLFAFIFCCNWYKVVNFAIYIVNWPHFEHTEWIAHCARCRFVIVLYYLLFGLGRWIDETWRRQNGAEYPYDDQEPSGLFSWVASLQRMHNGNVSNETKLKGIL